MSEDLIARLRRCLDPAGVLTGEDIGPRYLGDVLGNQGQAPLAVVRPRDTAEVSRVMALCHQAGVPVVTQGGRTGLVLSCLPRPHELVLSTERMTMIESVDADACCAIVQSGVVLQRLQEHLEPLGLSFPLDLGGRGSCTIGGNVSTNAGGNRVIRYGMTRDLVLGVEAVLADGTVIDSLMPLIKNNTGPDLKQLFIGSEGILGVVTRVSLKLIARPAASTVAFCGLEDFDRVRALLRHLRRHLGGRLSAFEVLWREYYRRARVLAAGSTPMPDHHGFYALIETTGEADGELAALLEQVLSQALEEGIIADAVIAKSGTESAALWKMRDMAIEVSRTLDPIVPFDVSLSIARMQAFVDELQAVTRALDPRCETIVFGHVGDGNLHLAVHRPADLPDGFAAIEKVVYDTVARHHGSVSAEHGIGLLKREFLGHTRTPAEIALMRTLKRAMDPKGLLNPDRVLDGPAESPC